MSVRIAEIVLNFMILPGNKQKDFLQITPPNAVKKGDNMWALKVYAFKTCFKSAYIILS